MQIHTQLQDSAHQLNANTIDREGLVLKQTDCKSASDSVAHSVSGIRNTFKTTQDVDMVPQIFFIQGRQINTTELHQMKYSPAFKRRIQKTEDIEGVLGDPFIFTLGAPC